MRRAFWPRESRTVAGVEHPAVVLPATEDVLRPYALAGNFQSEPQVRFAGLIYHSVNGNARHHNGPYLSHHSAILPKPPSFN